MNGKHPKGRIVAIGELLCWAAGRGFSWVEVRDPEVQMTRQELEDIRALADRLSLRIHYSWDNEDVLAESGDFYRGMEHAAIFGPETCCRVLAAPKAATGKKGLTKETVDRMIPVLEAYGRKARELGIYLCFENAMEPLKGDGITWFGMAELLEACPGICATLDAANATNCTTLVNPTEEELLAYYRRYGKQIFYYHLKVTRDHRLLDTVEAEGDFRVAELFRAFASNPEMWICLEIPPQPTLTDMTDAVEQSIRNLEKMEISCKIEEE